MLQPFLMSVDFKQKKTIREPIVTQYDDLVFVVTVFDNGDPGVIDGLSYKFVSRRPDNKSYYVEGIQTGENEITFDLGKAEVSLVGKVNAAVQLFDSTQHRLSSFTFNYTVTEDISLSEELSSQELTLLEFVVQEGPGLVQYFKDAKPLVEQYTDYVNDLNSKANQVDLNTTNVNLGNNTSRITTLENKKISQNDITDELRQQITGGTPINSVPADYSLGSRKFKNPMVIGLASKNLFDVTDISVGNYVSYGNGNLVANASYTASNYIPVSANTAYSISATSEQLAWYDINKVYISGIGVTGANMVSPANAAYVRISMLNTQASSVQFEAGSVKTSYENFNPKIDNTLIKAGGVKNGNIPNGELTKDKMAFIPLEGIKSKNLFDKSTVTSNKYVAYSSGVLADSPNGTHNASDYIPILPSTNYKISGTSEQGAFYDANKTYISGFTSASSVSVTPSNAAYLRITALTSQLSLVQVEKGTVQTSYEAYGVRLDFASIKQPITEDMLSLSPNIIRGTASKNLFDKTKVTVGYYVAYSNGSMGQLAGYNASDYIPILPNTAYKISGTSEQLAFYDANKTYISGLSFASNLGTTPANAAYIRMTVKDAQLDITQLEQGTVATSYIGYGPKITLEQVGFNVSNVERVKKTVKPDGTGDYLSPKLANDAISDSSSSKVYDIIIYPGTYTEIGWTLKPYINLIGKNRKTCWLKGELPDTATEAEIEANSTIWVDSTNNLENLKITAKNMRYAVHDESSGAKKDWVRNIKNCYIEHYGNNVGTWVSQCAYGSGVSSGAFLYAENTTFKAPFAPFSVHNNANYEKPCFIHLKGCRIEKVQGQYSYGLRVQSLGSGTSDVVMLEGCYMNAPIMHNDSPWLGDANATSHQDFSIKGYGNSNVAYQYSFATGETSALEFTDI